MNIASRLKFAPGFSLALVAGIAIWYISSLANWIDSLVAGILFGMILRTLIGERPLLSSGLYWAPRILIPPGIILYGARLQLDLDVINPVTWLQILVGLIIVVWLARTVGRWLKIPQPTTLLLAIGTAVCGASAIVIAAQTVNGNKRHTTTALIVITIWGLVGLGLLPLLAGLMNMNVQDQALLYATTLQQTGIVKAAAAQAGETCLSIAIAIKTARIATIIPLLLIAGTLSYLPHLKEPPSKRAHYKVRIPWYLWGFIISGLCFYFVPQLQSYTSTANAANGLIWTMAMVSIGLTVDVRGVMRSLGRPLLAGFIIWLGLLLVFLYTYSNAYL